MVEFFVELKEAFANHCLFAFNIDDFIVLKAVLKEAESATSPLIIQLSPGETKFWGLENFVNLVGLQPNVFLNIDHGQDLFLLKKAITLGFSMIHFDGSKLPWEENIQVTAQVVKMAHEKGVLVEGEPQQDLTDPQKAAEFVTKTGVDLVAVFVGNRHGMEIGQEERLDFPRLQEIKKTVGHNILLTLHGGSGVAFDDLKKARAEKLVAKININTLLRITYRRALEEELKRYHDLKIYQLWPPVEEALRKEIRKLFLI